MEPLNKKAKEADVESRVVIPLLTLPELLNIPHRNIRGKAYLQPSNIDKAAGKTTGYYPDYSIWVDALPLAVVEAKAPTVDVAVGYREASLYALHLNKQYNASVDPCSYIVATNGKRLLAGPWNAPPELNTAVEDLLPGTPAMELLKARLSPDVLRQSARVILQKLSTENTLFATKGATSSALLSTKVAPNGFTRALIPTLTRFFASPTDEDDPAVYDRGYVPTDEQTAYDAILENLLKEKAHQYQNPLSQDIDVTRKETRSLTGRISEYASQQRNKPQILLIIGHVGAGKSLFIRRYRRLLMPPDLSANTKWSFIDFNDAGDLSNADKWLSERYIESFEAQNPEEDIYAPETLDRLFATDLNRNRAVYKQLEDAGVGRVAEERAADIKKWLQDPETLSRAITRYYGGDRSNVCIAVFDNVDKLDKDDQLRTFQLAMKFAAEHRTLTILQLRDETFERYKDSKPLDTFKTGLTFHITPPRFTSVVRKRLEICIEEVAKSVPASWEYDLPNSMRVKISRDEAIRFLQEIYDYVFDEHNNVSRVIQGLAGRNVRRALDIFFSVLISGHFGDDRITSAGRGSKAKPLTDELILRILMRGSYRYFHGGSGFVKNIFFFDPSWSGADNFLIIEILFFLANRIRKRGTIGIEGFFTIDKIFDDLQLLGYPYEIIARAGEWLLDSGLVEADNMSTKELAPDASIRISSSGYIHLRNLSENFEYISGVLYDTPFLIAEMADEVGQMFRDSQATNQLTPARKAGVVGTFHHYLVALLKQRERRAPNLVGLDTGADYIIGHVQKLVEESRRGSAQRVPDLLDG